MKSVTSVKLLFSELERIDWRKNPHRGLLTQLGSTEYPGSEYGRHYVRERIFKSRNLKLAIKLKLLVNDNEQAAQEVLNK